MPRTDRRHRRSASSASLMRLSSTHGISGPRAVKIDASERRVLDAVERGEWMRVARLATARVAVQLDIMRVTIPLPDDVSAALEEQWDDVPCRSLGAIAVEGYIDGVPGPQVAGVRHALQVHALLKEHHVPLQYTSADIEDDLLAQRELGMLPCR